MLRCRTCPSSVDPALLDTLRAWRLEESRERGVPAYVVFTDATLAAIAERKPASAEALLEIPGIGPAKLDAYGSAVLRLVGELAEAGDPALDLAPDGHVGLELAQDPDAAEPDAVDEGV